MGSPASGVVVVILVVSILVGSGWVVVATPMSWVEVLALTGLDVGGSPATGVVVVLVVSDWV